LKNTFLKYFLVVFILTLFGFGSIAQQNNDFKKKYVEATGFIDVDDYASALRIFRSLDSLQKDNANLNFYIGVCLVNSPLDKIKAIPYLEKAIKNISLEYVGNSNETTAPVFAYYYLGKAYLVDYRLDEAIEYLYRFRYYLTSKNKEWIKKVDKEIEMSYNAKIVIPNAVKVDDENLGPMINTQFAEYSPVLSANEDTLIFTSRRPGNVGGMMDPNGKYYEDIYISTFDKITRTWAKAQQISGNVNTPRHEASIGLTPDGKQLFVYKDDGSGDGNIFLSKNIDNSWTTPEKLPEPINTKAWETHASYSADGNTIYFVSNRKGGFGGRDIYKSEKLPDGSWSKVHNLGRKINTAGDEDAPFIVTDSTGETTMYFSSNGHQSIGGFDIFSSKLVGIDAWTNPENMGYPINTTDDDVFYTPAKNKKYAYYSSAKPGGYGDLDIYKIFIGGKTKPKLILKGIVVDSATNKQIIATIKIRDLDTDHMVAYHTTDTIDNEFHIFMPLLKNLEIVVTADNYKTYKENFVMPLSSENNIEIYKKFILSKSSTYIADNVNNTDSSKTIECYTVQIGAGKMNTDFFNKAPNMKIIDCNDGIRRFVIGEYKTKEEALAMREQMIQMGFIGSWIRECMNNNDMAIGERIVLKNIFFDFNKTSLRPESKQELEKLVKLLNDHPTFAIEIAGHTDNVGSEEYNLKLSDSRAKVVYNYLIAKGINKDRLSYKGYAFKQPIATNTTDEGRQKNRRTEFRIISK